MVPGGWRRACWRAVSHRDIRCRGLGRSLVTVPTCRRHQSQEPRRPPQTCPRRYQIGIQSEATALARRASTSGRRPLPASGTTCTSLFCGTPPAGEGRTYCEDDLSGGAIQRTALVHRERVAVRHRVAGLPGILNAPADAPPPLRRPIVPLVWHDGPREAHVRTELSRRSMKGGFGCVAACDHPGRRRWRRRSRRALARGRLFGEQCAQKELVIQLGIGQPLGLREAGRLKDYAVEKAP